MQKINFFTPVSFGQQNTSFSEKLLEKVDSYFFLGGKKATVIQRDFEPGKHSVSLKDEKVSFIEKALKIASFFVVIIPLIIVAVKACLRALHQFYIIPLIPPPPPSQAVNPESGVSPLPARVPPVQPQDPEYDVVIIGAGPIGMTTACALKALNQQLKICVVDKRKEPTRSHGLKIQADSVTKLIQVLDRHVYEDAPLGNANLVRVDAIKKIFKEWQDKFIRTSTIEMDLAKEAQNFGVHVLRDSRYEITEETFDVAMREGVFKNAKVIVGADGAHSAVRKKVMNDELVDKETMQYVIEFKYQTDGKAISRSSLEGCKEATVGGNLEFESMSSIETDSTKPATLHIFVDKETYDLFRETGEDGRLKGVFGNSWTLEEINKRQAKHPKIKKVYDNLQTYLENVKARDGSCIDEKISTVDITIYRSKESVKSYQGKHILLVGDAQSGMVLQRGLNKGIKEAALAAEAVSEFFDGPALVSEVLPAEFVEYQNEAQAIFYNERRWAKWKDFKINVGQTGLNLLHSVWDYGKSWVKVS